jgi:GT2 family glycosyltransferase
MNIKLYAMYVPDHTQSPAATPETLYLRTDGNVSQQAHHLQMAYGSIVSFDTWFGCFAYPEWRKYTTVKTPVACFRWKGKMAVQCCIRTDDRTMILYQQTLTGDGVHIQAFPFSMENLPQDGFLYFQLQAQSVSCELLEAYYMADVPTLFPVHLAAVICTHQREKWVSNTIHSLLQWQAEQETLPVTILLVDNGQTWTTEQLPDTAQVHLFQNPNTGGSGGFTRGIQEALAMPQCTHILLMDDDIIADWNGVARMIAFLSVCKPEWQHTLTIGGTMLDSKQPALQLEAGAVCRNRTLTGNQPQTDLTDPEILLGRTKSMPVNYAAWWECCMPIAAVQQAGLPMPFFIKMDDVEYALQMQQQVVMMMGVCVWHENFYMKYAPWNEYYITRNGDITYALQGQAKTAFSVLLERWKAILRLLLLHRYDTATFVLQGATDFLRGWKWLSKTDSLLYHQTLLQKQATATEQFSTPRQTADPKSPQVSFFTATVADCRKQEAVFFYHPYTDKGFVAKRDRKRAVRLLCRTVGYSLRLLLTYRHTVQAYCRNRKTLCSDAAWRTRNHLSKPEEKRGATF